MFVDSKKVKKERGVFKSKNNFIIVNVAQSVLFLSSANTLIITKESELAFNMLSW